MDFPGPQGGQAPLTVCRSGHTLATDLDPTIPTGPPTIEYSGTAYLIDSVQLPNSTKWTFTYDSYGTLPRSGFRPAARFPFNGKPSRIVPCRPRGTARSFRGR